MNYELAQRPMNSLTKVQIKRSVNSLYANIDLDYSRSLWKEQIIYFLSSLKISPKKFRKKQETLLNVANVALLKLNYVLIDRDHHQQNHFFIVLSCCFSRAQKSAAKIYRFSFFSVTLISFWYHISYWRMHHNLWDESLRLR